MPSNFPAGSFKRRVAKYGEAVTLENDVITTDEDSDWNDQTITTTSASVAAVVHRQRTGVVSRNEDGDEVEVDATVYLHDDELGSFSIRDGGEGGPTTIQTSGGVEFVVIADDTRTQGVHEIEVARV